MSEQPKSRTNYFPHEEYELSAFDRTSSPPPHQVRRGMAEKRQAEKGAPAVVELEAEEPTLASIQESITKLGEEAEADYDALSDDIKAVGEKTGLLATRVNEMWGTVRLSLKLMRSIEQAVVLEKKASAEDIEKAYDEGFEKAKANEEKYRSSLTTQVKNLKLKIAELEKDRSGDRYAAAGGGGGGGGRGSVSLGDAGKEEDVYDALAAPPARATHGVKRPRNPPIAEPSASSSSSSSSSASAKKIYCMQCYATSAKLCICDKEEDEDA
jgi:hypothetical protein